MRGIWKVRWLEIRDADSTCCSNTNWVEVTSSLYPKIHPLSKMRKDTVYLQHTSQQSWECKWFKLSKMNFRNFGVLEEKKMETLWINVGQTFKNQKCILYHLDEICIRKKRGGASLVVQWLRLCAPNAGGPGSIPGQGTRSCMPQLKIPSAATKTQCSQINKY